MPVARYQLPDGRIARFEVPDGTTPEQAQQIGNDYFAQNPAQPVEQPAPAPEPLTPAPDVDVSGLSRFGRGFMKVPAGISQAAMNFLPRNFIDRGNELIGKANDLPVVGPLTKAAGIIPESPEQYGQRLTQEERDLQAARKAAGQDGIDWAGAAGTMLASVPLSMAMPGVSGGLLAKTGMAAAEGGLLGAAQPVYGDGDFADEKAKQAGIGAAAGGLLTPAAAAVGRVISPKVNDAVKGLLSEGVTPTPGQILGGMANRIEEQATSLPVVGDFIRAGRQRAQDQLNTAAYNRALNPIGRQASGELGRVGIQEVKGSLKKAYDDLLPNLQFKPDQQFAAEISNIQQMAQQLPPQQADRFTDIFRNKLISKMTPQGNMNGFAFKNAESELSNLAKSYKRDPSADQKLLGDAVGELLSSMRTNLIRSNPGQAAELTAINRGWGNYAVLRRAASAVGTDEGKFTAPQLLNAVKAKDRTVENDAFANGGALMQDLAGAGKKVLGDKVPDSGTAGRVMNGVGLTGLLAAGVTNPALAAIYLSPGLLYTRAGQKAVAGLLTQRPAAAAPIAGLLERYSPAISAAGGVTAPGLLTGYQ